MPYVRRKNDLPLYIGQIHAFYLDTTPYTLNDNVNTKSVWLNPAQNILIRSGLFHTWFTPETCLKCMQI